MAFTQAADNLSKRFEARFAKMPAGGRLKSHAKGIGGTGSSNGKGSARTKGGGGSSSKSGGAVDVAAAAAPTSEDRQRLAKHLACARMEDVTAAVHEIDKLSPDALVLTGERDNGGGHDGGVDDVATMTGSAPIEIEIDVDALDPWTFCAVERLVAPLAALRRASRATAMRQTKKKRPTAATAVMVSAASSVSTASTAGSSSSGKSCSGTSKKMAGSRSSGSKVAGGSHHQSHQQEGGVGAAGAVAGEVGVKGDRGDGCSTVGVAAGAGSVEGRPLKKAKASTGAGAASL